MFVSSSTSFLYVVLNVDSIPRQNLHSPPLSYKDIKLIAMVCICVFDIKRSCFILQLLQMCFFFKLNFFRHCQIKTERKRDGWEIQLFLLYCIINLGVSHQNQHLFRFTHIFCSVVGDVTLKFVFFLVQFIFLYNTIDFLHFNVRLIFNVHDIRFCYSRIPYGFDTHIEK